MTRYTSASVKILSDITKKGGLDSISEELTESWENIIDDIIPEICDLSFEEKKEMTENSLFSFEFFSTTFQEALQIFLLQKALVN